MDITNASTARAWLAAWGNAPRRGILKAAIQGQELRRAIEVTYRRSTVDTDAALAVLRSAETPERGSTRATTRSAPSPRLHPPAVPLEMLGAEPERVVPGRHLARAAPGRRGLVAPAAVRAHAGLFANRPSATFAPAKSPRTTAA